MTSKKYELLENDQKKLLLGDGIVYRIRALRDFGDVKAGDLGGYIAGEHNLSHDGYCWVYDEAIVHSNASVNDYAKVKDRARVGGNALLKHFVIVKNRGQIHDNVKMYGDSVVKGRARLYDNVELYDGCVVKGNAKLFNRVKLLSKSIITGDLSISAGVFRGDAYIENSRDFVVLYNFPFQDDMMTLYTSMQGLQLCHNCTFYATIDEFVNLAKHRWREAEFDEIVALITSVILRLNKAQERKFTEQ